MHINPRTPVAVWSAQRLSDVGVQGQVARLTAGLRRSFGKLYRLNTSLLHLGMEIKTHRRCLGKERCRAVALQTRTTSTSVVPENEAYLILDGTLHCTARLAP